MDEYTQIQHLETKARSIMNKASPDILPSSLYKPTAFQFGFEFSSQSQKTRYFKILKALQVTKTRITTNPSTKIDTVNGFILLHTRFVPSEEQVEKFIDFLMEERTVPANMTLKDIIFYMMTFDSNFDLAETDEYGINKNKEVSNLLTNKSESRILKSVKKNHLLHPLSSRSRANAIIANNHRKL